MRVGQALQTSGPGWLEKALEKAGLKLGLGGNLSPGFPHHDRFGGPFGPTPELESQLQFFKFINFKNYLFIWLHQVLVAARKPLVVAQGI